MQVEDTYRFSTSYELIGFQITSKHVDKIPQTNLLKSEKNAQMEW